MLREAMIFATWRRIAGEGLAEQTAPLRLNADRLVIAVSNLTWQRHLQDLAGQMLFKLNASLGKPSVSYIEFEINEEAVSRGRRGRIGVDDAEMQKGADAELTLELRQAAMAIADVELRKQFLAAAGACLVRKSLKAS